MYRLEIGTLVGDSKPRQFIAKDVQLLNEDAVRKELVRINNYDGHFLFLNLDMFLYTEEKPTTLLLDCHKPLEEKENNKAYRLYKL